jgi:hydrogenase maturation factor
MCIIKIGEVVKVSKKTALVKFKGKIQKVNISLLGDVKLKDKLIFSGGIALERVEDEN